MSLALARAASTVDDIDARDWHVETIEIEGNEAFWDSTLCAEILTPTRPWYLPWRSRPLFDPSTLADDLERLRRFYESRGFYDARIAYDVEARDVGTKDLLRITFRIEENEPSTVAGVDVGVRSSEKPALPQALSLRTGQRFGEEDYRKGETELKEHFLEHGYAHVEVTRSARVDRAARAVHVRYLVETGPLAAFDDTEVRGTEDVNPEIVRRELEWRTGEPFRLSQIKESRENLLKTDLFSSVRIGWKGEGKPWLVPMVVEVGEKPPREIKIGVGYATDEKYRIQLGWAHHNFFGGAREMKVNVKYSAINASVQALFAQPHFLTQHTEGIVEFRQDRDEEDNYVLYGSRLRPRLEHRFSKTLSASLGYRLEADKLSEVDDATVEAIGAVKKDLLLFGPAVALVWNTVENPLDPRDGGVLSFDGEVGGTGGDFRFTKGSVEAKKYTELPGEVVLANRLKIAFADSIGAIENLPLFERLYAGGQGSVRGYGRRRLGPRSSANDPIGGLSLLEVGGLAGTSQLPREAAPSLLWVAGVSPR